MAYVALLAEGVDRNWCCLCYVNCALVALLAEGVDRNWCCLCYVNCALSSPSSRRAWIEILRASKSTALLSGRPPRGGRG